MLQAKNRRPERRGFTLMEMLVVLAILVLLMAMVAPRIIGTQKKADVDSAKVQIGLFKSALERYALDMKDYPTTDQGLRALCEEPTGDGDIGMDRGGENRGEGRVESRGDLAGGDKPERSNWDGPYLNSTSLHNDPWGRQYQYEYQPTHGRGDFPDIWSLGRDGEEGTDDDIVSWTETQTDRGMGDTDRVQAREPSGPPSPSSSASRDRAP